MYCRIALVVIAAGLAHGNSFSLLSGVSAGETNSVTTNNVVLMNDEPNWTAPQDGAQWISFENTGYSAIAPGYAVNELPNATGESDPNAIFYQTFTDTYSPLTLSITVWADDTAVLFLDGVQESANANFSQVAGTPCAPTGITCNGAGSTFVFDDLAAGTHTIQIDVYQAGGGTYGVMYDGTVTDSGPLLAEPGSYILLGFGLIALSLLRLKRVF